jgi:CysZ protein
LFTPLARAITQLEDPIFLGVLVRSLLWSAACFVALHFAAVRAIDHLLHLQGWMGWAADFAGGLGASILALWLFLPVAVVISTFYIDRVAAAVERRYYPTLPPARGAPLAVQLWDGIGIAARILLLNVLALIAALFLPGVGLILAWVIGGYAIGRGLFAAVAMRRMPRLAATMAYRRIRPIVLVQGCTLALAGYVPLLNLLIPVIGTAVMVHLLDRVLVAHADRCG